MGPGVPRSVQANPTLKHRTYGWISCDVRLQTLPNISLTELQASIASPVVILLAVAGYWTLKLAISHGLEWMPLVEFAVPMEYSSPTAAPPWR